ncbi:barstar family protein [Tychonema sp. BBK16]|uniref:barstar family protein n=1 Tax=Tychonema sp. BBK16 TaxID=2699888 RepID=UPI001F3AEA88|nr:barstar family protein [Tychonema sp. BBK16]MCF6375779.1 barstar family protein [Tychonema sp. BBK16]
MASFPFPPQSLNEWCPLDEAGRRSWLNYASRRFFDTGGVLVSKAPGRVIILDGSLVDTLLGFYCAIGEAVNGPGGYFGRSMEAFDDCLFSGFGLEYPYTIVWRESQGSRCVLDAQALLKFLDDECGYDLPSEGFADDIGLREERRREVLAGARTLFDKIANTIRSVPDRNGRCRNGGYGSVTLVLE